MQFLSLQFLVLMISVLILLAVCRDKRAERLILLAASYIFYAGFSISMLILLLILSLFTYAGGVFVFKSRTAGRPDTARHIMSGVIGIQIAVLAFFKFSGLFSLPVGLSFYMLQAISLVADLYLGRLTACPSLPDALLYIGFFPQIVSGPVVKAKDFIPQLNSRQRLNRERLSYGLQMFLLGAFMKLVVADRLAVCVDKVYAAPTAYSGGSLFVTSVGYSLQLLFDFAGYSNMAIGAAWLLGFDLLKNFNLPYLAISPTDFWRRWHISLSSWMRDYVYIPLGGSRKGRNRTYINIFLTMIVSGLWHGSTVNFLVWGAVHGLGQVIYRSAAARNSAAGRGHIMPAPAARILTFLFVNFLWIPFRAGTLREAWIIISRIITCRAGISYYYVYIFVFGAVLFLVQTIAIHRNNADNPVKPLPLDRFYGKVILCILVIATLMFAYFGNGAFIYSLQFDAQPVR